MASAALENLRRPFLDQNQMFGPSRACITQSYRAGWNHVRCRDYSKARDAKGTFLKFSRRFVYGVAIVYGGGIVAFGSVYFYSTFQLQKLQPVPKEWSFKSKLLTLAGVNHFQNSDFKLVCHYYEILLKDLISNKTDLTDSSDEWLRAYSDVLLRYGISLSSLGRQVEAEQALEAGLAMPYGQTPLRNWASLILGKSAYREGDNEKASKYLRDAMSCQNDASGVVDVKSIEATVELAQLLVSEGKLQSALNELLRAKKALKNRMSEDQSCLDAVITKHISEVLWALDSHKDSVIWCEASYHSAITRMKSAECADCAQQSAELLANMYKRLNMQEKAEKFLDISQSFG